MAHKIVPLMRKKGNSGHELTFALVGSGITNVTSKALKFERTGHNTITFAQNNIKVKPVGTNVLIFVAKRDDNEPTLAKKKEVTSGDEGGVGTITVTVNGTDFKGDGAIGDPG